jgi:hypothetical protein
MPFFNIKAVPYQFWSRMLTKIEVALSRSILHAMANQMSHVQKNCCTEAK